MHVLGVHPEPIVLHAISRVASFLRIAMSENKENSSILNSFDSFLSDVNSTLAYKSFLEEENRVLKFDAESLTAEIQMKDEIILAKEEEIARLLQKHLIVTKGQSSRVTETKNEIRASAQLVEMRYEVSRC